jgi:hypothetical protein
MVVRSREPLPVGSMTPDQGSPDAVLSSTSPQGSPRLAAPATSPGRPANRRCIAGLSCSNDPSGASTAIPSDVPRKKASETSRASS